MSNCAAHDQTDHMDFAHFFITPSNSIFSLTHTPSVHPPSSIIISYLFFPLPSSTPTGGSHQSIMQSSVDWGSRGVERRRPGRSSLRLGDQIGFQRRTTRFGHLHLRVGTSAFRQSAPGNGLRFIQGLGQLLVLVVEVGKVNGCASKKGMILRDAFHLILMSYDCTDC